MVELNANGLVFLDDILIVQLKSNDVSVWRRTMNKMVDLNDMKIVHQPVSNVKSSNNSSLLLASK